MGYASRVCLLLISTQVAAQDYTDELYAEFSTNGADLSRGDLSELVAHILSGDVYQPESSTCNGENVNCKCIGLTTHSNDTAHLSKEQFIKECPQIVYSLTQSCVKGAPTEERNMSIKPPPEQVWGYGFLLVTLINLCSLAGIAVLPLMNKKFYSTLLMFLISLAVGSLSANGILVLIPEAFEIIDDINYIWRALVVVGGVYLFFITERLLKIITDNFAGGKSEMNEVKAQGSIPVETYIDINRSAETPPGDNMIVSQSQQGLVHSEKEEAYEVPNGAAKANGQAVCQPKKMPVATVAWMIIFGDAFHNFIDGLSIGAAFSESIFLGFSICIAVLCEELPHELGDFAILLNAGMSKRKALLFNFLSACTCYLGLVIGITLAEVAHATPWILGLAGGMFLYISLADMMPEMNRAAEEHKDRPFTVFLIQNLGLLTGFVVIFLVARYGGEIQV